MRNFTRLPRKLKKQIKKSPKDWKVYLQKRKEFRERNRNLDIIFTRDYENSKELFKENLK